jgi:hypothetical protein
MIELRMFRTLTPVADPDIHVLQPHAHGPLAPRVRMAVKNYLLRTYDISEEDAPGYIPQELSQWGKIHYLNGGDTIRAAEIIQQSERNMSRDATLIKVVYSFFYAT